MQGRMLNDDFQKKVKPGDKLIHEDYKGKIYTFLGYIHCPSRSSSICNASLCKGKISLKNRGSICGRTYEEDRTTNESWLESRFTILKTFTIDVEWEID